jgi:four helix bundle protein
LARVLLTQHRMGVSSFEELRAWQLAAELRDRLVAITASSPFREDFKFRDQLRDAACSAPRLIAEGFGRFGLKEFRRYLTMARAELLEVQNHLLDLEKRGWSSPSEVAALRDLTDHTIRVTSRLPSSLEDT